MRGRILTITGPWSARIECNFNRAEENAARGRRFHWSNSVRRRQRDQRLQSAAFAIAQCEYRAEGKCELLGDRKAQAGAAGFISQAEAYKFLRSVYEANGKEMPADKFSIAAVLGK